MSRTESLELSLDGIAVLRACLEADLEALGAILDHRDHLDIACDHAGMCLALIKALVSVRQHKEIEDVTNADICEHLDHLTRHYTTLLAESGGAS